MVKTQLTEYQTWLKKRKKAHTAKTFAQFYDTKKENSSLRDIIIDLYYEVEKVRQSVLLTIARLEKIED
jgi:benzoyl-CoA reductase/2-hydroxyglutaryl-CoA dehydratase subunit BcrC/BadD/HgdB